MSVAENINWSNEPSIGGWFISACFSGAGLVLLWVALTPQTEQVVNSIGEAFAIDALQAELIETPELASSGNNDPLVEPKPEGSVAGTANEISDRVQSEDPILNESITEQTELAVEQVQAETPESLELVTAAEQAEAPEPLDLVTAEEQSDPTDPISAEQQAEAPESLELVAAEEPPEVQEPPELAVAEEQAEATEPLESAVAEEQTETAEPLESAVAEEQTETAEPLEPDVAEEQAEASEPIELVLVEEQAMAPEPLELTLAEEQAEVPDTLSSLAVEESNAQPTLADLRRSALADMSARSARVEFVVGEARLTSASEPEMEQIFEDLFLYSESDIVIEVASQELGTNVANGTLADQRVAYLKTFFTDRGLSEDRLILSVFSDSDPRNGLQHLFIEAKLDE